MLANEDYWSRAGKVTDENWKDGEFVAAVAAVVVESTVVDAVASEWVVEST